MKIKFYLYFVLFLIPHVLYSSDYEVEYFFTTDKRDTDIMDFSDEITLRQFKAKANWKDNKGNYGVVECMGNYTIIKKTQTVLKMYCKEFNKEKNNFVIMFDRESQDLDVGVGKAEYLYTTGQYEKYKDLTCIYAVKSLENKGAIIKQQCKGN